MKGAYYNEFDPFAAAWLGALMKDGLIAPGEIDTRSIEDVRPGDLAEFSQCHFFAGIGGWSYALRLAGWPDDRPVWTGSCPCQPFSAAGKGGGFADERHLWPAFFHLIEQCAPDVVAGEQVASKDGLTWLDLVSTDMEAAGYAFGAVDTCAAGFGAPHIRQRLYWVANGAGSGRREERADAGGHPSGNSAEGFAAGLVPGGADSGLAHTHGGDAGTEGLQRSGQHGQQQEDGGAIGGVAHADGQDSSGRGIQGPGEGAGARPGSACERPPGLCAAGYPGPVNGLWRSADWLACRDGKWRPVEPGTFPLAHAGTFRNRVAELRGAGNAINIAQAQAFIEAFA